MSKAFTKEDDDTESIRLDDLPQSPHPNLVTPQGLADLQARLEARRADLAGLLAAPEDFDSKMAVAVAERDIRFLEARVGRAIVVDPKGQAPDVVAFGAEVDVLTEDDRRITFAIVGEDSADPARGKISVYSPIARALIGETLGSTVEWRKPSGNEDLEIEAIRFP
ncbi:GreA/GreB family elongation factor [Pararhodobacter oceanensis]|uniref:GreA/GreB family elongation factor n=1 Tax=Pararhodobacter oceanensis TaxID=2172121 RepID=UPI003A9578BA